MLVLELPAANRTLESRLFAAFYADVILHGGSPEVSLTALKADPHLLRAGCKRRRV